ncbi:MAG: NAD-binding protein [Actinomycetota bacterium]|nr:NAD-binding protein [Actinomycetota bacterium]
MIDPIDAQIIVFGMGRVGAGAYDELVRRRGDVVMGVDRIPEVASENSAAGRHVIRGDALDVEFWGRLCLDPRIELVVLAMSDQAANLIAVQRVTEFLPQVRIAATATHTDEITELEHHGVDVARNLYGEAGQGLADDACDLLDIEPPTTQDP